MIGKMLHLITLIYRTVESGIMSRLTHTTDVASTMPPLKPNFYPSLYFSAGGTITVDL
jgi:hypothetical protein